MPDELRNSRTVHNRLSSQLLYRLMDFRGWTELKLAEMSGIVPSVVSAHLCGKRPVRPQHLAAYLRVLDRQERVAFLDAWLRDNMGYEVLANLLDGTKTRSMSSVPENQCRMLDWWATAIVGDSKFAKIFTCFQYKSSVQVSFGPLVTREYCRRSTRLPRAETPRHQEARKCKCPSEMRMNRASELEPPSFVSCERCAASAQ
jgi:hypothetical protein